MRKIGLYIIGVLMLLLPTKASAEATVSLSVNCGSGQVGDTITCTVYASPSEGLTSAQGSIHIEGNAVSFVSASSSSLNGNVNSNSFNLYGSTQTSTFALFTVTLKANAAGNASLAVTLNSFSDGNFEDVNTSISRTGNITVTEPPKPNPEPVQPSQPVQNNNYNNASTSKASSETKKEETKKEETTTIENKEEPKEETKVEKQKLKIDKFYVVGYDIGFSPEKLDYTIDIDKNLKAIYIVVSGENLEITGDKEIDIVGKNRVVVRLKSGNTTEEYTIKLNRIGIEEEKKKDCDLNPIFIGTTVFFALTTIGLVTYTIIKKKRTV